MSVLDKAVSTEDLCAKEDSPALGVLRLEAILNTLVENKVEALKQESEKASSLHSSPKSILQKLKFQSTLRIEDETPPENSRRKERKEKSHGKQFKKQMLRQETSSPDSQILQVEEKCLSHQYRSTSCMDSSCASHVCYCSHAQTPSPMADEYISIKMDSYGDVETDAIIAREEMRRERRKRRRRRKRRLKKRLALNPHLVDTFAHEGDFKTFHDDELPPRAKWTIVATACLLLFMCLLLVGITLRMAPIIDEIAQWRRELGKTSSSFPRQNFKAQCEKPENTRQWLKLNNFLQCRRKIKVAMFPMSFARANMSSSESVELKRKSASNASCNSCEVLCNSRVILSPTNGRLNSTCSYSGASDCLQSGPRGLTLPGARRLQKTVSLEEICSGKKQRKTKSEQRRRSELLESGLSRKSSAKRLRKKSSQRRPSKVPDIEASPAGCRWNSESHSGKQGVRGEQSKEHQWRLQRRKRIIKAILGVYIFLLFISILSVVVTLTHTSTATVQHNNSTKNLTYYTFSPSPGVAHPGKT